MIDLHTHTEASDGTDTPEALIDRALALGLSALAITDHDTLDSIPAAQAHAAGKPIRFLPGVELSTRALAQPDPAFRTVHLLGYFTAGIHPSFRPWLESLRERRRARNLLLTENLQRLGFEITLAEAESLGRNITGRPHFAKLLCAKGYCRDWSEAFRLYLGETGAAYVEREDPAVEEGIGRIRSAGGLPVLAHPRRCCPPGLNPLAQLEAWREAGLAGLEIWHPDHGQTERSRFTTLARRLGLLVTGGSDYHGAHKPDILLGSGRHGEARTPNSVLSQFRLAPTPAF